MSCTHIAYANPRSCMPFSLHTDEEFLSLILGSALFTTGTLPISLNACQDSGAATDVEASTDTLRRTFYEDTRVKQSLCSSLLNSMVDNVTLISRGIRRIHDRQLHRNS